jgi:DNA-binding transcriptional LysR family regulator
VFTTMHYRELRERSVDLLVGRVPSPFAEDDLEADIIFDDQQVVVAGRASRWARSRNLKLADLVDAPWILPPPETLPGALTKDYFHASGLNVPRAPITTLSIHVCCRLVAGGRFVTALPSSILRFSGRDPPLKVLPIRLPDQNRPVAIVTLKNRSLSPVAKLFIECVRSMVKTTRKHAD